MPHTNRLSISVKKFTLATMLLATPLGAQTRGVPAEPFPAVLDRYIANVVAQWQIPGLAIAIVRNDSTLVAKGYGVRTLGKPERVDENTVFDIASLAKSFTATATAILVDRGVLSWDDPVHRFLPDLVLPTDSLTQRATVRAFLSHGTGLEAANMMWVPTAVDRAEVLRRMRYLRSVAPPGLMVYSNVGYSVAGEAAAAAAGKPFEHLLRDLLIKPLGLTSTTWTYEQAATMPNVVSSHATIDNRQQVIARELQRQAIAPAAAVQSTAADMARWLRLHIDNGVLEGRRFVSDSAMREMHSVQSRIPTTPAMRAARLVQDSTVVGYGLGWQSMDYRGHRLFWHTGNGDGQIAYMAIYPNERLGFVVMVNTWSAPFVHAALANYIADTYLGYEPRDWAAAEFARIPAADSARAANERAMIAMRSSAPPPAPLQSYDGKYEHPLFGPIWIRQARGGLTLQMGEGRIADLEYHGANTFYAVWRDPLFRSVYSTHVNFMMEGGSVVSFSMRLNRDEFTATKLKPDGGS